MPTFTLSDSAVALITGEATRRGFPDATALIDAHMASLVAECRTTAIKTLADNADDAKLAEITDAFETTKITASATTKTIAPIE